MADLDYQALASAQPPGQEPGYYDRLVRGLESARNFMGGDPTLMGSLGMALAAIPAGRGMAPRGAAPRQFGPRDLEPPPPLEPLDIKGMNFPPQPSPRVWDTAAAMRAEDMRRSLSVPGRTELDRSTDAAIKAIQEALKLAPK